VFKSTCVEWFTPRDAARFGRESGICGQEATFLTSCGEPWGPKCAECARAYANVKPMTPKLDRQIAKLQAEAAMERGAGSMARP